MNTVTTTKDAIWSQYNKPFTMNGVELMKTEPRTFQLRGNYWIRWFNARSGTRFRLAKKCGCTIAANRTLPELLQIYLEGTQLDNTCTQHDQDQDQT